MRLNRNQIWPALVALFLPQQLLAIESIESVSSAVEAAESMERELLIDRVSVDFLNEPVGFRSMLEPLLPRPQVEFDLLDAEISTFFAQGKAEQARLQEIIDRIDNPADQSEGAPIADGSSIASENETLAPNGFFYSGQESQTQMLPNLTFSDDGSVLIDTTNNIDLPDLTIDPRNGGEYSSEIEVVQAVLDVVQVVQDQVPAPIQSAANTIYNNVIGALNSEH